MKSCQLQTYLKKKKKNFFFVGEGVRKLHMQFLLADSIFIPCWTYFCHTLVTYVIFSLIYHQNKTKWKILFYMFTWKSSRAHLLEFRILVKLGHKRVLISHGP